MVYFSISGFFYTYLWTRLILLGVMSRADQDATEKLRRIEEQDEIDLRAMTIVDRYLAGRAGPGDPAALTETVEKASARARKLIFYEAEEARTRSWRQNKAVVERTIPIFRALIAADHDELYYKTKAKLAYALKDQREPSAKELSEAITLLSDAIERRNLRCEVIPLYEFNRALCRIMLDENFRAGRPSDPDDRALICADLDAVRPSLGEKLAEEPIARWLELNYPAAAPVAAAPIAALPKAG
jgi:hypothetical protein